MVEADLLSQRDFFSGPFLLAWKDDPAASRDKDIVFLWEDQEEIVSSVAFMMLE